MPAGKVFRQLLHLGLDPVAGFQGVGAGCQPDCHAAHRFALVEGLDVVVFGADLALGHILQPDRGAVAVGAQDDGIELLRGLQQGAGGDGGVQLLPLRGGGAAELAGGDLGVLGLQRRNHIVGGQVVVVQLGRVQPDPHGVLGAEHLQFADPFEPADDILDVGDQIVGQGVAVHGAVFRDQTDDQQEVPGGLDHLDPLALHDLGQQRRGQLQLVLHLHLGDVRVGAGLEGQVDGHRPGRVAGGGHVDQVVDPVQLLFDDLGDRILHGLGRGARDTWR